MQENNFDIENGEEVEIEIYTLTDEDGKESDFELIGRNDLGGQSYVALVPVGEDGEEIDEDEEGGFVILKVVDGENGEEEFIEIEDDEEFDKIADIFEDELFEDVDYDEDEENEEEDDDEDDE
ncbi:MAG: DUF1292 domain-containing protein [Oscillospiraceae bacterium]|nr:DUF1292 domain-containing protein [Oscillospiraceae bacterium]